MQASPPSGAGAGPSAVPSFLRLVDVLRVTGLARSTVYRMMAEHAFPAPCRLGRRAVGWRSDDSEALGSGRCTSPRTFHELQSLHLERPGDVAALLAGDLPVTRSPDFPAWWLHAVASKYWSKTIIAQHLLEPIICRNWPKPVKWADGARPMNYPLRIPDQLRPHLRALRKRQDLTQAQLGALVGVKQARIAEIEANPGAVSLDQLSRVLAVLGATLHLHTVDATPPAAGADAPKPRGAKAPSRPAAQAPGKSPAKVRTTPKSARPEPARAAFVIPAKKGTW
jgi:HTH-type transcriptional regulator/antitoxin HipB